MKTDALAFETLMGEKPAKPTRIDSRELTARLRRKFGAPEYAFMEQVRNGTGFAASRTADAVAMGVWPSRGLHLIGFEIKISRSDWLREKKKPQKAEDIVCYMDRWYVVVSDADIVKAGELPDTWGLIALRGAGLTVMKEAPALKPCDVDRSFLAAMFRNMLDEKFGTDRLADHVKQIEGEHQKAIEAIERDAVRQAAPKLLELRTRVEAFEKASGLSINNWSAGDIGAAVKAVVAAGVVKVPWSLKHAAEACRREAEQIEKALAEHWPGAAE